MSTSDESGRLSGKVAIVTGASRGIGEAIALALAAEGVRIQSADDLRRELETRPEMRARLAALLRRD